jgi:hypothetical protein
VKRFVFTIILIGFAAAVQALDLKPWYETDFELYPRVDFLYQQYSQIDSSASSRHQSRNDLFITLGISGSYTPWEAWVESTLVHTRRRCLDYDNLRVTGRYQWMSDTIGDSVCLTTGLILTISSKNALENIGSFHHATFETEANISIGKETICLQDWLTRYWGIFGIGMGIHGSPWGRLDLAWENRCSENLFFRLFLNFLWGFGNHSLRFHHFEGYGNIRHRSIDIGAKLTKDFCIGILSFEYAHRVYACNFPAHTNLFLFRYSYPFGL